MVIQLLPMLFNNYIYNAGLDVITEVVMNKIIFWDIAPGSPLKGTHGIGSQKMELEIYYDIYIRPYATTTKEASLQLLLLGP
jgi:hypothetical protein